MPTDRSAGQPSIETRLARDPDERHGTTEFVPDGLNDESNVEDSDGGPGDWPGAELNQRPLSNEDEFDEEGLPDDVVRDLANSGTVSNPRDVPDPAP